jgi:hypothetical protein
MSACATLTQEKRAEVAAFQEEIKTLQGQWNEQANEFHTDASALTGKVRLLTNHPGWAEMAKIITGYYSRVYVEGADEAARKRNNALGAWTHKWDMPGKDVDQMYEMLVGESAILGYQ